MDEKFNNLSTIGEKIAYLKDNGLELPNIEQFNNEWDEKKHRIMTDLYNYPDRIIEYEYTDENGEKKEGKRIEKLNRIPLAYQKEIVSIAVTFLFGNPVKYTNNLEDTAMYDAFLKVTDKEKIIFIDREIAKANGRFTQCAELWYPVDEPNNYYGFPSQYRLKVSLLTPDKNKIYPFFDDQGNLIAILREYEKRVNGQKVKHYDIFTAERIAQLRDLDGKFDLISDSINPIGKIPLVFYQFEDVEWSKVQKAIERLEEISSDAGEVNKKFSAPILALSGKVTGSFSKDKTGKVLQLTGDNSRAEFVQPPNASESLANEKEDLETILYKMTNSVNISPEALQGMGNMLATENAAFLFMLPHLKVMDKMSVYIPALKRRMSIVKSFLQLMNTSFRNSDLDAEPVITPYIINNEAKFYEMLMTVNGNQPLFSQKSTMERAGVKDVEQEMKDIDSDLEKKMSNDLL
ncbi:phage portal protein [Chryseobacterium carnipullorum]|uniref:Phage portal protein n=3 Tax=Chryseobacterium carnipullorum TaxID=1124835 RepID=A0A3G6N9A6_CHRCU|nr:phage portal protein [Chryseobacterium carnipullorum]AZA49730.1 phage portal protein [Chryseobacterium carnipullorum]AZA64620.1 phage portal protein [Chryseobacterium carnipullorum]